MGEERRVDVAVLPRAEGRLERLGEHIRQIDPQGLSGLRRRRAQPDPTLALVEASWAGRAEDHARERAEKQQRIEDYTREWGIPPAEYA